MNRKDITAWVVTYYDIKDNVISTHVINNRHENEAEDEAIADLPVHCEDWSLMPEGFFAEKVLDLSTK